MRCYICDSLFESSYGHGGNNRKICFDCLPYTKDKNARSKQRRDLHRRKAAEIKLKKGCQHCGYKRFAAVLEYHHTDESLEKLVNPSNLIESNWLAYLDHVNSCVLLCANCHREEHIRLGVA